MKFVAISDIHLSTPEIPEADILLDAGDMTYRGNKSECIEAAIWRKNLLQREKRVKQIIAIAGNHDWAAQKESGWFADLMKDHGIHYLFDSGVVIAADGSISTWFPEKGPVEGIKVWGSPWQPWFHDWAFNLLRGKPLKEKWDLIPQGTDIIITHGPPNGILDRAPRGYPEENWSEQDFEFHSERVGCTDLLEAVKRIKPKVHLFGHIHADYGVKDIDGTKFINAAIMDERYDPMNKPVEFQL